MANTPHSNVHGAYMGPTWGQQDPGGPHVGPMNIAIGDYIARDQNKGSKTVCFILSIISRDMHSYWQWQTLYCLWYSYDISRIARRLNLFGVETVIYRENYINVMVADALVPCISGWSVAMIFSLQVTKDLALICIDVYQEKSNSSCKQESAPKIIPTTRAILSGFFSINKLTCWIVYSGADQRKH